MPYKDLEVRRAYANAWKKKNGYKAIKKYGVVLRDKVFALLGGKCSWSGCEWTDPRALQVDHVNSNGHVERKKIHHTSELRNILKMVDPFSEYQLLCANHNWVKKWEKKEFGDGGWKTRLQRQRANVENSQ